MEIHRAKQFFKLLENCTFFFQSSIHSNMKYKWNSEKTILISKYLLGHTLINILMVKKWAVCINNVNMCLINLMFFFI